MPRDRILIVDDEESVAITMQAILEMDGHEVATAASVSEATAAVQATEYDLVLSDLRLDDGDGLQIVAETRRRWPESVCIILTGYASLDSAVKALREGAYDYLVKPCDVEELRLTVQRGLERRRLGRQLRERVAELEAANKKIERLNADLQRRVDEATAELRGQYERLQELDRLKTQFMSVASHELKTPVTAMSGFLQVALRRIKKRLEAGHPDPKDWALEQKALSEQLVIVQRQTTKLARLIDELLDVSRIQSGRVEFHADAMDLRQLAIEVAERMQTTTTTHTIAVEVGPPVRIAADRDHLEQVLNNLIANAVKYSPDGGDITVRVGQDGDAATISVQDAGIGIPAEELDAVFGLFYRSPDRRARDVGGMGLGLYISKEIVDRHGGRIWAESEIGRGTTFQVRLPRTASFASGGPAPAPPVASRA
ncbi:MAG TPA: ATP-binding protein [Candidatus Limnocylindria bacterium]|nr:ATP-binding protein [Candidatus Limnocylindria bacterium]